LTTVLVVDDQAFVRKTIRSMIADKTGWQLCEAENGKVAVDVTKKNQPDVVVLDLVMPVMGGLAAAYEIGKIAPDAKIVFISSHYTPEQASSLTRLFGASRFVPKSEMGKELIPTIKKLLTV
jgi:DNA-binding NarL/FixJ family response regulator